MDNITLKITILDNVQKVWTYFNEPKHIEKWYFADKTWHCTKADNDLKVGAYFKYRMESKKEDFGSDFEGVYDEILPFETIKSHLLDGRKIEVHFNKIDENTTELIEIFEPENDNLIDMQRDGWYLVLNNFHKYVENN